MTICNVEVYQWDMDIYRDSLRSTSGICMTIGIVCGLTVVYGCLKIKTNVYQRYMDDNRGSVRSTSGSWMTIRIV